MTNRNLKESVREVMPTPIWAALRSAREYIENIPTRRTQRMQVRRWRKELDSARSKRKSMSGGNVLPIETLCNRLPNSGGLPLDIGKHDPGRIFKQNLGAHRRWSGVKGFEGLALDDALSWFAEYRIFSFVPLASAVAEIFRAYSGRPHFSVLELGCGSGALRTMLDTFGATSYLGVDANPIPFSYSPFMQEAPRNYRLLNLQERIDFGVTFDVVCSFEVFEHIHEEYVNELIWTVMNHMGEGSLFIGTASITEEYDVHITVKTREWWLERFALNGLIPLSRNEESSYLDVLGKNHPFNWRPANTSMFILRKRCSTEVQDEGRPAAVTAKVD